jgi:hypothetical protein
MGEVLTNRQLSKKEGFVKLCEKYGIKPTPRQASKFRMKKGSLWFKALNVERGEGK